MTKKLSFLILALLALVSAGKMIEEQQAAALQAIDQVQAPTGAPPQNIGQIADRLSHLLP